MNRLSAQSLAVFVVVTLAAFATLRNGERANESPLRGRTGELSSRDRTIDATVRQLDFEGFVDDDSVDFVYDEDGQDDDNDDISSDEDDDDNDDDDEERKLQADFDDDEDDDAVMEDYAAYDDDVDDDDLEDDDEICCGINL